MLPEAQRLLLEGLKRMYADHGPYVHQSLGGNRRLIACATCGMNGWTAVLRHRRTCVIPLVEQALHAAEVPLPHAHPDTLCQIAPGVTASPSSISGPSGRASSRPGDR